MIKIAVVLTLITLSSGAHANKRATDLQPHIQEQSNRGIELEFRESDTSGLTRSQLKVQEDIAGRFRSLYSIEMDKTKAKIALDREDFILKNVPIQYVIAGERAVQQYIQDNFIQPLYKKEPDHKVSWSSTNNALTVIDKEPEFQPVVQVSRPVEPVKENKGPSDAELARIAESLGALGISVNEAGEIAQQPRLKEENIEPVRANVILNKVNVKRMLILGERQQLDATLYLSVLAGPNKREISFNIESMTPGTGFSVEGVNFNFIAMTPTELRFINAETGVEFKERVR